MQLSNILLAGSALFVASQAVIIEMYSGPNCSGNSFSRNIYDNTCAYTGGFQSYKITTYGGGLQQLTVYSPQACAGAITSQKCVAGVNRAPLNTCFSATNSNGGSNAATSYSSGGVCPN